MVFKKGIILILFQLFILSGCTSFEIRNRVDEKHPQKQFEKSRTEINKESSETVIQNTQNSFLLQKEENSIEIQRAEQSEIKRSNNRKAVESDYNQIPGSSNKNCSGIGIPVLMYHSIETKHDNDLCLPKEKFRAQMKWLKDNNYKTLDMNELIQYLTGNTTVPDKSVMITMDDGYANGYTEAFPILKEFGLKAAIFVVTNFTDQYSGHLSSQQIKEMDQYGIDIGSHTTDHLELNKLSYDKQYETLKHSKDVLQNLLGHEIVSLAYPVGKYNSHTLKSAAMAGYSIAFTTKYGLSEITDGILKLDRIRIGGSDSIEQFKVKIKRLH